MNKKLIAESIRTKGENAALFFFLSSPDDTEKVSKQITESLKKVGIDTPVVVLPYGVVKMEVMS
jgi:hypothetical protein